jgi:hypothetical protein
VNIVRMRGCIHRKVHANVVTDCGLWNQYVHEGPSYFTYDDDTPRVRCPACFIKYYQRLNKLAARRA